MSTCLYHAEWWLDRRTDLINFTIWSRQSDSDWTGIAFAEDEKMVSYFNGRIDAIQDSLF